MLRGSERLHQLPLWRMSLLVISLLTLSSGTVLFHADPVRVADPAAPAWAARDGDSRPVPPSPPDTASGQIHRFGDRALPRPRSAEIPIAAASPAPGYEETSEFFAGRVGVAIFLVESSGNVYDWTDAEVTETLDGIYAGLTWWAAQEPKAHLSFTYELHIREPTTWEPIQNSIGSGPSWIDEIMGNLGYTESDPWQKTDHFNNDVRARLGTDWAYSIFVADSDDAVDQGLFAGGGYAWAYYGGPWVTMSRYSSWAYNSGDYFRVVPAHETGHIFYATDEYDSNPAEYSGYLNCPDDNGASGIMNRNTLTISASTRCQIGWVDADGDGLLDVLGVPPETTLDPYAPDPVAEGRVTYRGNATVVPLTNQNPYGSSRDVTISRVTRVDYALANGPWVPAEALDGAFDGPSESFTVTAEFPIESSVRPLPTYQADGSFAVHVDVSSIPSTVQLSARAVDTEVLSDPTPASDDLGVLPRTPMSVELWWRRSDDPFALYGSDTNPPWEWAFAAPPGSDGVYSFYSIAMDPAGIRGPVPSSPQAQTIVDTAGPVLVIGSPVPDALLASNSIDVTWSATDAVSGIDRFEVRLDNGAPQTSSGLSIRLTQLSEGDHIVSVAAYDRAGNVQTKSVRVTVDTVGPILTIISPRSDATITSASVEVTWTAGDEGAGLDRIEVRLDAETPQSAAGASHRFAHVSDGPHTVTVTAYDRAGNIQNVTIRFDVDTGLFSVTGPYGPLPLATVLPVAVALSVAITWVWRRRHRKQGP